ncbi:MAG: hypothetical protein SFY80_06665 [Verrucomicrobiota bacterium]|nr:hypothetical protein [Verrucomicrobiota bacterium]
MNTTSQNVQKLGYQLEREKVLESIDMLGREDLQFLNTLIVKRLRYLNQMEDALIISGLNVGTKVRFDDLKGQYLEGFVAKISAKSVSVCCGNAIWKVAPSLIERVV